MRKPDLSAGASERARGGANVAHASIQALAPSARKRGELRAALMVRLVWSLHRREARHGGDDSQIMFETSLHFSDIFKKGVSLNTPHIFSKRAFRSKNIHHIFSKTAFISTHITYQSCAFRIEHQEI